MGLGTLTNRANGQTILDTFFNDIHGALDGDFVGRNTSGVPTASQNLGTAALPWGTARIDTLILNGSTVDPSNFTVPSNIVVSGKTRSTSNQPAFITPAGASLSFDIKAAITDLVLDVNGSSVAVTTDITKGSLTAAPGANNTALVNDTEATGQEDTRLWGEPEHRKNIIMDTVGSNISALIGKYAAFKIGSEYFIALVESATVLSHVRRGFFYDSSLNPINRAVFSNNDTITLEKLGWIFVENDGATVDVTYNNPTWSFTSPSSPATGDYWYDLDNNLWKRYDGASFQIINRTIVGLFVNTTTACVGARCIDFYKNYSSNNSIDIEVSTTEITTGKKFGGVVSVAGNTYRYEYSLPTWNITTDLATSADMYNATEQASTLYYLYISDLGETIISDISPYFRDDLRGEYHPHNPWRCVGLAYNNGSNNIVNANGFCDKRRGTEIFISDSDGHGSTNTAIRQLKTLVDNYGAEILFSSDATNGASFVAKWPGRYTFMYFDYTAGSAYCGFSKNSSTLTTAYNSLTAAELTGTFTPVGSVESITIDVYLKIGDTLRPHTDGTPIGDDDFEVGVRVKSS